MRKTKEYLSNAELTHHVLLFQKLKQEVKTNPELKPEFQRIETWLANAFYLLIANIFKRYNYQVDHEDTTQDCVMMMFKKLDNYKVEKGNCFNYHTSCCMNFMRYQYRSVQHYNELKARFYQLKSNSLATYRRHGVERIRIR